MMKQSEFGEIILSEDDLCDLLMKGVNLSDLKSILVDESVRIEEINCVSGNHINLVRHHNTNKTIEEFDKENQSKVYMPSEYAEFDIAGHVLGLCKTQAEMQRCGKELLLYQEKDLFWLLKYLKYLVDTMKSHSIIWGVGRGSSVSSYVLYKLGVHRIDSMYYDLDIEEFLR